MSLPAKPRYGEACNRCGLCCKLEICTVGVLAFPGAQAPCPGLKLETDGKQTYCALVRAEQEHNLPPLIAKGLGIGNGCGMRDDYEELINFISPTKRKP